MQSVQKTRQRRHFIVCAAALALGAALGSNTARAQGARSILVLGDSLSAEYGLARGTGWVALLEQRLQSLGKSVRITNASVSGDTTSGGRARLPALLRQHQPEVVIIELGANDALRGLPLAGTRENLRAMVQAAQQAGAQVLLLGMQMPPNYGRRYAEEFAQIYADLAQAQRTRLLPFFLKHVADAPQAGQLFQADRIHPNAQAQPILLDNVWPQLEPLL